MDKIISCAGVTLGNSSDILTYLTRMLEHLFSVNEMAPVDGVDQAVHNIIFHENLIPGSMLMENGNELCMTMGPGVDYKLNAENHVVSGNDVIAILHQYDRYKELKGIVEGRYSID